MIAVNSVIVTSSQLSLRSPKYAMTKRKLEQVSTDSGTVPASSENFASLVSKYSFSVSAAEEDVKPASTLVTPPRTPRNRKSQTLHLSPSNSRNPSYAPPSAYSHLPTPDLDALAHDLVLLFIGLNPGMTISVQAS